MSGEGGEASGDGGGLEAEMMEGGGGESHSVYVRLEDVLRQSQDAARASLVHEMSLNSAFRLSERELPPDSLEARVKSAVHAAFWDLLKEDLAKDPPDHAPLLRLLGELKESLLSLTLPHQSTLKAEVERLVDLEEIGRQAEAGVADFSGLSLSVVALMARFCAPARDAEVAGLKNIEGLVDRLRGIMETLGRMLLDMANFTIDTIRPTVAAHGVDYEREKFAAAMDGRPLPATQAWLRSAAETLQEISAPVSSAQGPSPPPSSSPPPPPSAAAVAAEAYAETLEWPERRPWPETLVMDAERLSALKEEFFRLSILASALLVSASAAPAAFPAPNREALKAKLADILKGVGQRRLSGKLVEVAEAALEAGENGALSEEATAAIRSALLSLLNPDHPVRSLVRKRLRGFLKALLEGGGGANFPLGLSSVREETFALAKAFLPIVAHNRAVHSQRYDDIIQANRAAKQ